MHLNHICIYINISRFSFGDVSESNSFITGLMKEFDSEVSLNKK